MIPENWPVASWAWTPDSQELVFIRILGSSPNLGGDSAMYRVALDGTAPRRMGFVGDNPWYLDVSRQGGRLAFTRLQRDVNLYRVSLDADGRLSSAGEPFASSSRLERAAVYSPDGARLAFTSDRGGGSEIWRANRDGSELVQLTESAHPLRTGFAAFSPDGGSIAYEAEPADEEGTTDIFVVPTAGGPSRRVTHMRGSGITPSWSRDGEWIYFGARLEDGTIHPAKVPAGGGDMVQLTELEGLAPRESRDGRWVYFVGVSEGLFRMPASGGPEEIIDKGYVLPSVAITEDYAYFVPQLFGSDSAVLMRVPVDGGEVESLGPLGTKPRVVDFDLSPDGREIVYSQCDQCAADIMLVENFH